MDDRPTLARAFERESHRIDQLIWDTMALRAGETVLFCGFENDVSWIARAVELGIVVSVVASDEAAIRDHADLNITVLKGSTTLIPARDASFDVAVAFHYLHEVDPFFHANVVSELARVGKRLVIVEPAPPSDPLGLRIASLYSRAKRELGQFEYYQNIDYWRKLLAIVKADVTQETFSFTRTPPRDAIKDTVALILDTMAVEETPEPYLLELRALAKRPDAQLVPQARYVLVGAASGAIPQAGAGTKFREKELEPEPARVPVRAMPVAAATAPIAPPPMPTVYQTNDEPEMPPLIPVTASVTAQPETPPVAAPPPPQEPEFGFGLTPAAPAPPPPMPPPALADPGTPFGLPFTPPQQGDMAFGLPIGADPLPRSGFGWEWEPPDAENTPPAPESEAPETPQP
jgi:hypothetical protein